MHFIEKFKDGDRISDVYLCKSKSTALTKSGKEYENVMLQDKTGQMDSKIWDPSSGGICDFDAMDYVAVTGQVISFNGALQLKIERIRKADEGEYVPSDYIPCSKYDIEEMYTELMQYIGSVKNEYLSALLKSFFTDDADFIAAILIQPDLIQILAFVIDLAACVLELDSHSVHVLVKAVQRRLPLAAERRSVQLDRVGILDGRLFHNDLKVVLLFPVAAIAIVCRVVLRCLFRPRELKANRAVRLINHIALRKQKATCQQQNDHQQHRQHTSAAPAPVIAGIALRSARFSCHCPLSPPFFRTPMLPSAKQKINKNLSVFVDFPHFVWLQP